MRRGSLFGPWEQWRKAVGIGVLALAAIALSVLSLPLGVLAPVLLFTMSKVWKGTAVTDYDHMTYTQMTFAYRVALFMEVIRSNAATLFTPVVMFGAGPPREDPYHFVGGDRHMPLQPGFWPPYRLAAWWSLLGALVLSPLEAMLNVVRMPLWGAQVPWPILAVLSLPGWFALFQVLADVRRLAPEKDSGATGEPVPATMVNLVQDHMDLRPSIIDAAKYAIVPTVVILLVWSATRWAWWLTLLLIVLCGALTSAALWSRNLAREYRSEWVAKTSRSNEWYSLWLSAMNSAREIPPIFAGEFDLPSLDEWEAKVARWEKEAEESDDFDDMPPQYAVHVKCASFYYQPPKNFADMSEYADVLRATIPNVKLLTIEPVGDTNAMGMEIPGTVGSAAFRLFYATADMEIPSLMDDDLDEWQQTLTVGHYIIQPMARLKSIGRCVVVSKSSVTRPGSPQRIRAIRFKPLNSEVRLGHFLDNLSTIQNAASVEWVRVGPGTRDGEFIMYYGDAPVMDETQFVRPSTTELETIDKMNWLYYFHANKLMSSSGTPQMIRREKATPAVDKLVFSLPPGLSFKSIKAAQDAIATSSANDFVEISLLPQEEDKPRAKSPVSMYRRELRSTERTPSGTQFSIIAAKRNPLQRVFPFLDYSDQVLTGREPGVEKINWAAGVLSDDTLAWDEWENNDAPHLLVAGASGSGKSVCMSGMILQLAHNNGPGEVNLWMIEPKNEMQIYRNLDVVTRFVDSWTPNDEFMKNAADLLEEAVEEMQRRNQVFTSHPKQPKKLSKARAIALAESERNGTPLEEHPLYMPYIIVIIEECASLMAAVDPSEKADQDRLKSAATELARKARSAGIHLVLATQYPTKESIPSTIKVQMRSIGFRCKTEVASRVVINDVGLEDIRIKGAGMIDVGGELRQFRGFWVRDGDPDEGEDNDIVSTLSKLPSNTGQASALDDPGGHPRILIPDLSDTVYNLWNQSPLRARAETLVASPEALYSNEELDRAASLVEARPDD